MNLALQAAPERDDLYPTELVSPTSQNDVLELKDFFEGSGNHSFFDDSRDDHIQKSNVIERFVCVTGIDGSVKYSNFRNLSKKDAIIDKLNLKSKVIGNILETLLLLNQEMPENNEIKTLLNGHICLVTLNSSSHHQDQIKIQRIPAILKLQLAMEGDGDRYLIWSFKKASIRETTDGDEDGFKIEDQTGTKLYKFTKLKFVLAIDRSGNIINAPYDLLSYLFPNRITSNFRRIDDIISVSEELRDAFSISVDQAGNYQNYSVSSPELGIDERFPFPPFSPFFTSQTRLKTQFEMKVSVNLFDSIRHLNELDPILPLQIKYESQESILNETYQHSKLLSPSPYPEFSGFKVIRKLSESFHSTVYEAIRIFQPDSRVIIKQIHPSNDHVQVVPNELKFYAFFCNDPVSCDFIEKPLRIEMGLNPVVYMESRDYRMDLFEYINTNKFLPNDSILKIFFQIAKAIEYLHSHRIVHRDIKDENILINTKDLRVKLIDFGSSAFLEDHVGSSFTEYIGTFSYAPVEVLKGQPLNGPEQDIWCLGIVLYVLCFKEPPFHSPKEVLQGYLRLPIERPSNFIQLIRNMLDPRPEKRPSIKTILQEDIFINFE